MAAVDQVYELPKGKRTARPLALVALVCLALGGAGAARGAGFGVVVVLTMAVLTGGWSILKALREPYRIVVNGEGLVFVARARREAVPWADLAGVTVQHRGIGGLGTVIWVFAGGYGVFTSAAFGRLDHLLGEVERRAPHARVLA